MGFQDFISETEAVTLTGMSKNTLSRFAEAGYLQLEVDSDGLRLFSKGELSSLFGLRENAARGRGVSDSAPKRETAKPVVAEKAPVASEPLEETEPESPAPLEASIEKIVEEPPVGKAVEAGATGSDQAIEIQRLRNVLQLQEQILDLKDQQLKDLKDQRDWLQARVEKLEDKADRDQVLLMTGTQTIRTLVNQNKLTRRSPVRLALEWLGVAEPQREEATETDARTVDVR